MSVVKFIVITEFFDVYCENQRKPINTISERNSELNIKGYGTHYPLEVKDSKLKCTLNVTILVRSPGFDLLPM
jgi:hypothetical protein